MRPGEVTLARAVSRPFRGLTGVVLALLMLGAVSTGLDLLVFTPRLAHSWQAVAQLRASEQAVNDQETGVRAYLFASAPADRGFLAAYLHGVTADQQARRGMRADGLSGDLQRGLDERTTAALAWQTGWASSAIGEATGKPHGEVFLAQGDDLFSAYRRSDARVQEMLAVHVQDTIAQQRVVSTAAGLAGLLVVLGALWAVRSTRRQLAQAVTQPLSRVAAAVRAGAEGDLTATALPVAGIRELDELSTDVTGLFTALRRQNDALHGRAHELDVLGAASRALLTDDDPRSAICRAAAQITGASETFLFEPDGAGALVDVVRGEGPAGRLVLPLEGESTLAAEVFRTHEAVFVDDVHRDPRVSRRVVADMAPTGGAWLPVMADQHCLGVLVVGLPRTLEQMPPTLPAALQVLAGAAAVAIERSDLHAQLASQARLDGLTSIPNRRTWDTQLPQEIARARRSGQPLAVVMLDLDHFKAFNDTRGHQAGDQLLQVAARHWSERLRTTDLLARYGGEEFALALPDCDLERALPVVDALRALLPDGQTCSAGVTVWDGSESAQEVLARADAALYEAKHLGRDRAVPLAPLYPSMVTAMATSTVTAAPDPV